MSSTQVISPFKDTTLTGKVALVTGGTSGIGLEIARQLALHGASIAVSGRRQQVLDLACKDLLTTGARVLGLQGDVRQQADCERWVQQIVEQLGGLDILVNCAAGNFLAPAEKLTANGFRTVMEIDAMGTFVMSKSAFPALCRSSDPSIINISATLQYGATWFQVHASAAKAAVDSITRSLALEWGRHKIRVNGIAPGPIEGTAGLSKLAPGKDGTDLASETIPLGRLGKKWDIAMSVVFLASPAAGFVTGTVLVVDGAQWMWRPSLLPPEAVAQASRGLESKSRAIGVAKATSKL